MNNLSNLLQQQIFVFKGSVLPRYILYPKLILRKVFGPVTFLFAINYG